MAFGMPKANHDRQALSACKGNSMASGFEAAHDGGKCALVKQLGASSLPNFHEGHQLVAEILACKLRRACDKSAFCTISCAATLAEIDRASKRPGAVGPTR